MPDSQEDGDSIYKTYLETLTGILGKDEAYRILDSFSDGAKARQAAAISEIEITVPGDGSADTVEAAGTTEEQETPGVIEEVPENPQPEEIPEEEPEKPEEPEPSTMKIFLMDHRRKHLRNRQNKVNRRKKASLRYSRQKAEN